MKKSTGRSFFFYTGILFICIIMAASFVYVIHVPQKQAEKGRWVEHTREVIGQMNLLEGHIYRAAFAYHMQFFFLFNRTKQQIYSDFDKLKKLTKDNPSQKKNIIYLRSLVDLAFFNPEIIIQPLDRMRQEEKKLLFGRKQAWYIALLNTQKTLIISQLFLFLMILFSYKLLFNELLKRYRTIANNLIEESRLRGIVSLQNLVITSSLDINEVMKRVLDSVRELIKADGSVIERLEQDEMVYEFASGSGAPFLGLRISVINSFSGKAVRENRILKCDDAEIDRHVDRAACKRVGVRSMIVVPLHRKGSVFGVLKVFSSKRAAFSNTDIKTLEIVAGLISARITDASSFSFMRKVNEDLQSTNAVLGELAITDGLTGLYNHRYFMQKLNEVYNLAQSSKSSFSIIFMDVDCFKKFNDSFGHVAGDHVLNEVGVILKKALRDNDVLARYGGEEFSVLLPDTGPKKAALIAERLRTDIASAKWKYCSITISVGVSTFSLNDANIKSLLDSADKALYAAKKAGRNCVVQA